MWEIADMSYDIKKDVFTRAAIRDRMIADMARALEEIANWQATAKKYDYSRGARGAQEHAADAMRRYREAWSKL
jgi:hypothetical protein